VRWQRGLTIGLAGTIVALGAAAQEFPDRRMVMTFAFPAPAAGRATLKVGVHDIPGLDSVFRVKVGDKVSTFVERPFHETATVEVPADPRAFIRFTVQKDEGRPLVAMALLLPGSRALLETDGCNIWDLATKGHVWALPSCARRGRECPTGSSAYWDGSLAEAECGAGRDYCVPDFVLELSGEAGQKVRVEEAIEGDRWVTLGGPTEVRRLTVGSGGRCARFAIETGAESVLVVANSGEHIRVRVSARGMISAEEIPPPVKH
jgi:hypothetical protein